MPRRVTHRSSLNAAVDAARHERAQRVAQFMERLSEGRKLYSDADGLPILRESYVVYLDTLGTREAMASLATDSLREQVSLLDDLSFYLHSPAWQDEYQRLVSFSDNIALAVPVWPDGPGGQGLGTFLDSIARYQLHMSLAGRLTRGGVAVGELYADDRLIIGPALVEAVTLEEDIATSPRIILSDRCTELVIDDLCSYADPAESPWNEQLLVDSDGVVFLDYLDVVSEVDVIEAHRRTVVDRLKRNATRIRDKYRWVADYHNHWCRRRLATPDSLLISDELSEAQRRYPRHFRLLADGQVNHPPGDVDDTKPEERRRKA